jgi:hypothetical protein
LNLFVLKIASEYPNTLLQSRENKIKKNMKNIKVRLIGFTTLLFIATAVFVSCNKNDIQKIEEVKEIKSKIKPMTSTSTNSLSSILQDPLFHQMASIQFQLILTIPNSNFDAILNTNIINQITTRNETMTFDDKLELANLFGYSTFTAFENKINSMRLLYNQLNETYNLSTYTQSELLSVFALYDLNNNPDIEAFQAGGGSLTSCDRAYLSCNGTVTGTSIAMGATCLAIPPPLDIPCFAGVYIYSVSGHAGCLNTFNDCKKSGYGGNIVYGNSGPSYGNFIDM